MNKKPGDEPNNLEIKNFKYWSSYYAKENEKIVSLLKLFGLEKSDILISGNCANSFETLCSFVQKVKMDDVNKPSIFATLRQLIQKKADLDKCIEDNFVTNNQVTEIFIKLNIIQAKLLKDIQSLSNDEKADRQELQGIERNIQFMEKKIEKYQMQINELKSYNDKIEPSITHEAIVADQKNLKMLKKQLDEVQLKLDIYKDLPANMTKAKLKIQSLENEIEQIDNEIEKLMGFMS